MMPLDLRTYLAKARGGTTKEYRKKTTVFSQGSPADAVFYIEKGKVKLTVLSSRGKEAVVAILGSRGRVRRGSDGLRQPADRDPEGPGGEPGPAAGAAEDVKLFYRELGERPWEHPQRWGRKLRANFRPGVPDV